MNENDRKLDPFTISAVVNQLVDDIADTLDWLIRTGDAQTVEDFDALTDRADRQFNFAVNLIRTLHNK